MAFKIIWSEESLINLDEIVSHLEKEWTERELEVFEKNMDNALHLIATMPDSFPKFDENGIRKYLLEPYYSILYRQTKTEVVILTIWNQHKDPNRLKYWF